MKNTLIFTLTGALAGVVLASYLVPSAISWYMEPGGIAGDSSVQALVDVAQVVRYATGRLLRGQLIGGFVGGSAGLALGIFLMIKARQRLAEAASLPPTAPPAEH